VQKYVSNLKELLQKLFPKKNLVFYISSLFFIVILSIGPISQNQDYHHFVDTRSFLGIPNFIDVTTNILFGIIGITGLSFLIKNRQKYARWSWLVFFVGIITLCFTSGYYHWNPNDATLVWDRLSLAVMFMSLVVASMSEHIDPRFDRWMLGPLVMIGLMSVIYWAIFNDLRFYIWAQLTPMLVIPVLIIFYTSKYSHAKYLWITFLFYLLAKITELYDREIFVVNGENVSGHSLKHIFAAIGLFFILQMLRKRKTII